MDERLAPRQPAQQLDEAGQHPHRAAHLVVLGLGVHPHLADDRRELGLEQLRPLGARARRAVLLRLLVGQDLEDRAVELLDAGQDGPPLGEAAEAALRESLEPGQRRGDLLGIVREAQPDLR